MRVFIAIELPENIRAIIQRWSDRIVAQTESDASDLRYVRLENLHVTLKFLGEVSEQQLPSLCEGLSTLRCEVPLTLWPSEIECFPKRGPVATIALRLAGD